MVLCELFIFYLMFIVNKINKCKSLKKGLIDYRLVDFYFSTFKISLIKWQKSIC
jgi:hypothetical protein